MKIFHHIGLIALICLALFIVRDDVKVVYNRASTYLSSHADIKGINDFANKVKDTITVKAEKIAGIQNSVNTPGALKVTEGLLANARSVKLTVKDVILATNKNRLSNGALPALAENSKLDASAKLKLDDMFKQQYFEHVSPDGVGVSDLGEKVSYEYIVIGENLALGNFEDAQSLLNAWMASPGHRANILNKRYTEIGVAVGRGIYKGQETWLAVQHFGLPRSACPSIDEVLHSTINLKQKETKDMESDLKTRRNRIDSGAVYEGKTTNEQISEYNSLVAEYNSMIAEIKEKVSIYNTGVRAFNTCLATNS